MFRTGLKWLAFAVLALGSTAQPSLARPLTTAEETVCKNIRHCLDILKNHDVKDFDYQVLKDEFNRFEMAGKKRLLKAISDEDPNLSRNAVNLLSLSDDTFSAAEIKLIADQWPRGDIESLAGLMLIQYSPAIRQAAIETLTSQNEGIANWSRKILKFGEKDFLSGPSKTDDFNPSPENFDILKAAAIANPTREITHFLARYPSQQAQPILRNLLSTERSGVVHAALKGLYSSDPESSFEFLRETVSHLEPGDEKIALAVADAVRTQYVDTQDKKFIDFARHNLTTPSASELEALVSADILMGLKSNTHLPETTIALNGLQNALRAHGTVPLFYMGNLPQKLGGNLEEGLELFWNSLEMRVSQNASLLVNELSTIPPNETSSEILLSALNTDADWRVVAKTAEVASKQNLSILRTTLEEAADNHPVLFARAAALAALDGLSENKKSDYSNSRLNWEKTLAEEGKYCSVKAHNFKTESTQLPYFNSVPIAYAGETKRASLTSAVPTGNGWLAGYDQGELSGGLVYYDNRTGAGELIYGQPNSNETSREDYIPNILGIAPKIQRPIGQYGEEYWAFSGLNSLGRHGSILSVSVQDDNIQVSRDFLLPEAPKAIERLEDNSLLIGFDGASNDKNSSDTSFSLPHPPLRLLPDGKVVPGCSEFPQLKTQASP